MWVNILWFPSKPQKTENFYPSKNTHSSAYIVATHHNSITVAQNVGGLYKMLFLKISPPPLQNVFLNSPHPSNVNSQRLSGMDISNEVSPPCRFGGTRTFVYLQKCSSADSTASTCSNLTEMTYDYHTYVWQANI